MPLNLAHVFGSSLELGMSVRLVVAVVLGALMGIERSLAGKHAGMRTYALVCMGSCLFVVCGTLGSIELSFFSGVNPMVVASSIVTGIGFIGAGLAAFRGAQQGELTTAAGLWVVAAVGMAAGFGLYIAATTTVILALITFSGFARLEHALRVRFGADGE